MGRTGAAFRDAAVAGAVAAVVVVVAVVAVAEVEVAVAEAAVVVAEMLVADAIARADPPRIPVRTALLNRRRLRSHRQRAIAATPVR